MGPPPSPLSCKLSLKQPFQNFGKTNPISEKAAISTIDAASVADAETGTSVQATAPRCAGSFLQNKANWDNSNNLNLLKPGSVP